MSEYTTDHDLKSYEDLSEIDEARNVFLNEDIPNGVNVIDTIKKLKTLNNMQNPTKTWQEEKIKHTGEHIGIISEGALKTLVSEIRKRDMEALIEMLPKDDNSETFLYRNRVKKIIQDYYEN